jgi:poly-gamma-glutamate synthesis protein (capsule biosynthesis protein)
LDWGPDGLFDTLDHLHAAQLQVIGAGRDIAHARQPAIVTKRDVRVGFLAYCSILPSHYWAEVHRPGCAPMRAFTVYEPIEPDQPGTPARIHTYAQRADLEAMREDIAALRQRVDRVVISLHWGIHFIPAVIADYQREVARAAIDAGADLIIGHHAHILKGAEIYRGKPILYSVGNFAMDLRMDKAHAESKGFKEIQSLHPEWVPDFDSLYNFPPESRMTMIATVQLNQSGPVQASFLPCFIDRQAQPELLKPDDQRFEQIVQYMRDISRKQHLTVDYQVVGDRVLIVEARAI